MCVTSALTFEGIKLRVKACAHEYWPSRQWIGPDLSGSEPDRFAVYCSAALYVRQLMGDLSYIWQNLGLVRYWFGLTFTYSRIGKYIPLREMRCAVMFVKTTFHMHWAMTSVAKRRCERGSGGTCKYLYRTADCCEAHSVLVNNTLVFTLSKFVVYQYLPTYICVIGDRAQLILDVWLHCSWILSWDFDLFCFRCPMPRWRPAAVLATVPWIQKSSLSLGCASSKQIGRRNFTMPQPPVKTYGRSLSCCPPHQCLPNMRRPTPQWANASWT